MILIFLKIKKKDNVKLFVLFLVTCQRDENKDGRPMYQTLATRFYFEEVRIFQSLAEINRMYQIYL